MRAQFRVGGLRLFFFAGRWVLEQRIKYTLTAVLWVSCVDYYIELFVSADEWSDVLCIFSLRVGMEAKVFLELEELH